MHRKGLLLVSAVVLISLIAFFSYRKPSERLTVRPQVSQTVITVDLTARSEVPSTSVNVCANCHKTEYDLWAQSQHALANRLVDPAKDQEAMSKHKLDGNPEAVIGVAPLIQYLIAFPGGRLQTLDSGYDPQRKEWFGTQDPKRETQDWGYWKNRGMNWNAQCAFCHMTNLQKGYDLDADSYKTTWDAMGITCAQCHGPMKEHLANPGTAITGFTDEQAMDNCASCHSRRGETTGTFHPGDLFLDHFRPARADDSLVYYADGQVREEVYEWGSFLMSRMRHKGVICADCHDPHSGKLKFAVDNNALCMNCHAGPGLRNATVINPAIHLHHKEGSRGNACVECHMPITKYMVRDPRRDHGFTSPDPQLTKEIGIPNACGRCHVDEGVDWAVQWVDQWYGKRMKRPARERARLIVRAQNQDATVVPELIEWIRKEEIPMWHATLISLLTPWTSRKDVQIQLIESLKRPDALVRSAAVQTLAHLEGAEQALSTLRNDPVRLVRLDAAWATLGKSDQDQKAYDELLQEIRFNSDQPAGAVRQSQLALIENRPQDAESWMRKAVSWDATSAAEQQMLGQVLNAIGKKEEAATAFQTAAKMEPQNPDHPYRNSDRCERFAAIHELYQQFC